MRHDSMSCVVNEVSANLAINDGCMRGGVREAYGL